MTVEIVPVPCLEDNFAYLVHASGGTALVDAPEAAPILAALDARGWSLDEVLITHHHDDHVQGLPTLRERFGPRVTGASADAGRLPPLDRTVGPGEVLDVAGLSAQVLDVPGHTRGHVAYHMPEARAVFTADSLMALGCGRLFEGTADEMWASLKLIDGLPGSTTVYQGHDYLDVNLRFARTIEPGSEALAARAGRIEAVRREGRPMDHPTLDEERATNPMLRAGAPEVKAALGMEGARDAEVFAEIRRRRDSFS